MSDAPKKSGMAALIGRSNVGKSTLINSLIGTKVAITSPKPQTTRHAIQGVLNDEMRGQVVFVDTPGIFKRVPDRLTAKLNEKARESMTGIDCLIYVVDPTRHVGEEERLIHGLVMASGVPKIMVLNKSDRRGEFRDEYLAWSDGFSTVLEISALHCKGLKPLIQAIFDLMPEGEPLYPLDRITNIDNRFWLSEIIREKVFIQTQQEVPFGVTVEMGSVEERENGTVYVQASLITRDKRHKKMLIGHGGEKIKAIGRSARRELEAVTNRKIFLDLEVSVDEKWEERFV
ncbi:GTPase Era [Candidatus Uhrbacteria bacterium]|nr:GTPase Era [Candidatus Uhrbacteria bacterium]